MGFVATHAQGSAAWANKLFGLAAAAALGGCAVLPPAATAATPASPPIAVRVLVKLAQPSEDGAAIAAEAARHAGVPVRYAAAASMAWHALTLVCTSPQQCAAAIDRLRASRDIYEAVEPDGRMKRQ